MPLDLMEQNISKLTDEIVKHFVAVVVVVKNNENIENVVRVNVKTMLRLLIETGCMRFGILKLATGMLTAEFHISHNLRF